MTLQERIARLPRRPGVYVFRDRRGRNLYVGKSVSLRERVASYFRGPLPTARIEAMVGKIHDFEVFETGTEAEALVLEYELIGKLQPRYNIVFRDDKSYPSIKITREAYPRVLFTRKLEEDGGAYLGPYTNAKAVRRTVNLVSGIFKLRTCTAPSQRLKKLRLCLQYHMDRCSGPCEDLVSEDEYREQVDDAVRFLKGQTEDLVRDLRQRMHQAAGSLQFERAARYRDQAGALEKLKERQSVSASLSDREGDVLAIEVGESGHYCIQQIFVRQGRIQGQHKVEGEGEGIDPAELLGGYVNQYYLARDEAPSEILSSHSLSDAPALEEALRARIGHRVTLRRPLRGRWRQVLDMAKRNARLYLDSMQQGREADRRTRALEDLRSALHLPRVPCRIEGFDVSTLLGGATVASMVSFLNGAPDRASYRRFRIRSVQGQDDFASLYEVVSRRYERLLREGTPLPDLILIDGGKGQLASALSALAGLDLGRVPVISLAKREEIVFSRAHPEGLVLGEDSEARRILQHVRDEAHRFAVTYHRRLRARRGLTTRLSGIPGVGPARLKKLLRHFEDPTAIAEAGIDQLAEVVPRSLAETIHACLSETTQDGGGGGEESTRR